MLLNLTANMNFSELINYKQLNLLLIILKTIKYNKKIIIDYIFLVSIVILNLFKKIAYFFH